MTPERRREIEEEEAFRHSIRAKQDTPLEKWGCKYPLFALLFLIVAGLIYCLYLAATGQVM